MADSRELLRLKEEIKTEDNCEMTTYWTCFTSPSVGDLYTAFLTGDTDIKSEKKCAYSHYATFEETQLAMESNEDSSKFISCRVCDGKCADVTQIKSESVLDTNELQCIDFSGDSVLINIGKTIMTSYACSYCRKSFFSSVIHERHERTHHGERRKLLLYASYNQYKKARNICRNIVHTVKLTFRIGQDQL